MKKINKGIKYRNVAARIRQSGEECPKRTFKNTSPLQQ